MENINNIEINFDEQLEHSYRRGYSHGYTFGMMDLTSDQHQEIISKIREWREDLTNLNGAPGSYLQDAQMYNPKI